MVHGHECLYHRGRSRPPTTLPDWVSEWGEDGSALLAAQGGRLGPAHWSLSGSSPSLASLVSSSVWQLSPPAEGWSYHASGIPTAGCLYASRMLASSLRPHLETFVGELRAAATWWPLMTLYSCQTSSLRCFVFALTSFLGLFLEFPLGNLKKPLTYLDLADGNVFFT